MCDDVTDPEPVANEHDAEPEPPSDLVGVDLEEIAALGAGDILWMRQRAQEHRLNADRLAKDGSHAKAKAERQQADELMRNSTLALDPVFHTTGRVTEGRGGELAIGTEAMKPFVNLVRERPDMVVVDASRRRMELASKGGALVLGIEAAETVRADNSLEKMLAHEAAAAHVAAMELQAEMLELLRAYRNTDYKYPNLSVEAARLSNASARMMETYQRAVLTLQRLRTGGKQTVVVQHVNVGDGGQAVVAGQVKSRSRRRGKGRAAGGG